MEGLATLPPPGASAALSQTSSLAVQKPFSPSISPVHGDCSLSSSPRQFATDLTSPILEEGDESESDIPNEPVTPVSCRQSQDFNNGLRSLSSLQNHDALPGSISSADHSIHSSAAFAPLRSETGAAGKVPLIINTTPTPPPPRSTTSPRSPPAPSEPDGAEPPSRSGRVDQSQSQSQPRSQLQEASPLTPCAPATDLAHQSPSSSSQPRRNSRSSLAFGRRSFSFFRRSNSQTDKPPVGLSGPNSLACSEPTLPDASLKPRPQQLQQQQQQPQPTRRWSMNRSSTTTRSNTPPTPPPEMLGPKDRAATEANGDVMSIKKKTRSSTGLSLRTRAVNFVTSSNGNGNGKNAESKRPKPRRRASSFDLNKKSSSQTAPAPQQNENQPLVELTRQPWAMPAEAGTGMKARRLSLSLPDDFTVDVAELQQEFEYQHKFLGRHGKHLGKGATCKVTLMMRKGCPGELYAVKEFRGKTSIEKKEDYENKVKSEFTLAKSLHHPNIVETIRLCTDHGRWNHVMEYCSEGDLYSLVEKKYLKEEGRQTDRLCIFKQLIQGLNYLHSNGIAHRDVKLENLLVTKDSKLKITDFGVSEVFCGSHPGLRESGGQCGQNMGEIRLCSPGLCGSIPYVSPEVLAKDAPYDPRGLDVWGAAVIAINLFFGAPLWKEARDDGANPQYSALVKGWQKWDAKHASEDPASRVLTETDYPYVPAIDFGIKPPALKRIVLQMLNPDSKRRISIANVLNHRWMKNVECCQLESYDDPTVPIDASKKTSLNNKRIFCHNHLPPQSHGNHSLGKMPGQPGY